MKNRLHPVFSKTFRKDYALAIKRGFNIDKLDFIIDLLCEKQPLPPNLFDHALKGSFGGFRELHIKPNWLLVYKVIDDKLELFLFRTGTHDEVFKKRPY